MMNCHKKDQQSGNDNNNKCENNSCNPFMACAYGNFYLAEKSVFTFSLYIS